MWNMVFICGQLILIVMVSGDDTVAHLLMFLPGKSSFEALIKYAYVPLC